MLFSKSLLSPLRFGEETEIQIFEKLSADRDLKVAQLAY